MKIINNVTLAKALKLDGTHSCEDGLFLAVRGGSKRWVFRDRIRDPRTGKNTKIREAPIGPYGASEPGLTMSAARTEAKRLYLAGKAGTDPKAVTAKAQAKGPVIVSLRDELLEYRDLNAARYDASGKQIGGWDAAYYREWPRQMEKHVLVHLGDRDSGGISGVEFAAVLRTIWHRPVGFKIATSLNAVYKRACALAKNAGRLTRNPIPDALAELPKIAEKERDRQVKPHGMMTAIEAAALYGKTAAAPIDDLPAKALQLELMVGCVRSAEVLGMTWGELADDLWTVPGTRAKSGNDRIIPLVAEAVALLAALRRVATDTRPEAYVFSAWRAEGERFTADGRPFVFSGHLQDDSMRIWLQANHPGVDAETGKRWSVHGLRHCYTGWVRSWASVELYWAAEFGLDHANKAQTKAQRTYDRGAMLTERKMILGRWADHLTGRMEMAQAA